MLFNGPKSLTDTIQKVLNEVRNPQFEVPEGIEKEGVAHFMGAAAAAHKAGQKKFNFGGKVYPVKIKPHIAKQVNEEELVESDYSMGDKVRCKESGMTGEVVKIDEPQTGKYYTVKRKDGKMMKYAPDELTKEKEDEVKEQVKSDVENKFPASGVTKHAAPKPGSSTMPKDKEKRGPIPAGNSMKEEVELQEGRFAREFYKRNSKERTFGPWLSQTWKNEANDRGHTVETIPHPKGHDAEYYIAKNKEGKKVGYYDMHSKRGKLSEEVEDLDELDKSTLASYAKKATHDARIKHGIGKDFERISKSSRKPEYKQSAKDWEEKYKSDARRREAGVGKAIDRLAKEEVEIEEAKDTPGQSHQCALHVKSEQFGEGRTLFSQHAEPDENGDIAWYDVMFEHGIEKHVPTADLEIMVSESHMNHKKKMKEEVELDEARGRPRKHPIKPKSGDEEDDEYGPDTGPEPDQNIVQHLKKSVDTKGTHDVKFADGSSHKVPHHVASTVLGAMGKLKPADRLEVQKHIHQSHKNLMDVHRMIK